MLRAQSSEAFNPYQTLRLHPDAPRDLIDEVYWALVQRVQDITKPSSADERLLSELNRAYAVLSDAERRQAVNRELNVAPARPLAVRLRRKGIGPLARTVFVANHTDYYHLLRVARDADIELIALAYSVLSTHVSGPQAEAAFLRDLLREAHEVLGSPQRRAMYDASIGVRNGSPSESTVPGGASPHAVPAQPASDSATLGAPNDDLAAAVPHVTSPDAARESVPAAYLHGDTEPESADAVAPFLVIEPERVADESAADLGSSSHQRGRKLIGNVRDVARAAAAGARSEARIGLPPKPAPEEDIQQRLLTLREEHDAAEPLPTPRWHPEYGASIASAELIFIEGPRAGARVPLGHDAVTMGSAFEADVMLLDDAGGIEPQHARIWQLGDRFVFRQIAENGTLVEGRPPTLSFVILDDGDEIQIGAHRMRFSLTK